MMTSDNLLDLRLELVRTNRMIRDELACPRPDLVKIVDLRRHENSCVDRLGKAIARMRAAERRRSSRSSGALEQQGAAL